MGGGDTQRRINVYCPLLSTKIVEFVAWDEQKLDLGSIARTFGLDPTTLKLNGHFISRGPDLIASSVTWNSLLSFFSSRGFSTGATHSDPLIVTGKFFKLGSKRGHDSADVKIGSLSSNEHPDNSVNTRPRPEDSKLFNTKRFKDCNSGTFDKITEITSSTNSSLKRKFSSEDPSPWKRIRTNNSDLVPWTRNDDHLAVADTIPKSQLPCSLMSENMKRTREDEILLVSPCKRIR